MCTRFSLLSAILVASMDHVKSYGGGLGLHMGQDLRLRFNVDKIKRESEVALRCSDNLKFGTSVTYNF